MSDPDTQAGIEAFRALATPLWKYPTAVFGGITIGAGEPEPRVAIMCQAGGECAAIKKKLDELLAQAGPAPIPVSAFETDGLVGILVGYSDVKEALAGAGQSSLGASAAFKGALAQVDADPICVLYFDVEKVWEFVDALATQNPDPQFQELYPKIREASGLPGLKRIIVTSGFDGQDWCDRAFVEAPAPRKGLLTLAESQPLSDELLKMVPQSATTLMAGDLDPARAIATIRSGVGEVDQTALDYFDRGMGAVKIMVFGKDLAADVLEPLGAQWALYCDPSIAGTGLASVILVNKLDDPVKAQAGLTALTTFANNMAVSVIRDSNVQVAIRQLKSGDLTVSYIAVPLVSPAWTIKDGWLYAGMYPQTVVAAATRGAPQKSILDNDAFNAMRKRLGPAPAESIVFMDLPKTAPQSYGALLAMSRLAMGLCDIWGVPAPEMVLPPLDKLMANVTPIGAASWTDDAGFHSRAVAPFPGSVLLAGDGGGLIGAAVVAPAMVAGVAVPSMQQARRSAQREARAAAEAQMNNTNLAAVGQGIMSYAAQNQGQFPRDLGTLVTAGILPAQALVPVGTSVPPELAQMKPAEQADWINRTNGFVYLGGEMHQETVTPEIIIAYENPAHGNRKAFAVLFGDAHVEILPRAVGQ
ncbi:MAG: hypothetical protein ACREJC_23015, partial [Tepidisphaeraceae bacterium]